MTILRSRIQNNREAANPVPYILISWIHYQGKKDKIGQTLSQWEKNNSGKYLIELFTKIDQIQTTPYLDLLSNGILKMYHKFPKSEETDFSCPSDLCPTDNWGTIQKLHGIARVAGFLKGNIFYIVFLDEKHVFSKSSAFHKSKK